MFCRQTVIGAPQSTSLLRSSNSFDNNQRTNGPVNAHLISVPTVSTETSKIGQGPPRVIIYIKFVELESPMLRAKFQDHTTSDSGEKDF